MGRREVAPCIGFYAFVMSCDLKAALDQADDALGSCDQATAVRKADETSQEVPALIAIRQWIIFHQLIIPVNNSPRAVGMEVLIQSKKRSSVIAFAEHSDSKPSGPPGFHQYAIYLVELDIPNRPWPLALTPPNGIAWLR